MMRPLPIPTSTSAALPLMRSPPKSQPERSGSLSFGYQPMIFTLDAGTADVPSAKPSLTVGLLPRVPAMISNTGEFSAQAIDSFGDRVCCVEFDAQDRSRHIEIRARQTVYDIAHRQLELLDPEIRSAIQANERATLLDKLAQSL